MTKRITQGRILNFNDEPILIDATDEDGNLYLCDRLPDAPDGARFLVVPVTGEQMRKFEERKACLRTTLEEAGVTEWYVSEPHNDFREPFAIRLQKSNISSSPLLPRPHILHQGAWFEEDVPAPA